jgi:hypothetical protein
LFSTTLAGKQLVYPINGDANGIYHNRFRHGFYKVVVSDANGYTALELMYPATSIALTSAAVTTAINCNGGKATVTILRRNCSIQLYI